MICWLLAAALSVAPSTQSTATTPPAEFAPPLNPGFRHYGVLDGLPSDAAYTVVQDHSGYIWIGTRDGLARFDGNEFRTFRHDPGDPDSIAANDVSAVLVDAQGRVWAGGEGSGLNLYIAGRGGFQHWRHDSRDSRSLSGDDVMALAQDPDGAIWVGVYAGGINRLLADGHGFSHVRHRKDDSDSLLSDNVTALAAGVNGNLWIGTDAGLQRRDRRGHLTRIALPGTTGAVTIWQLNASEGGVDAATDAGMFRIGAAGNATRLGEATPVYASLRDPDGDLWTAHQGELDLLSTRGVMRHYRPSSGVAGRLPGALPLGMGTDREGGIWIALLDGGVAYLPPRWRAFDGWRHTAGDADSLAEKQVRALAAADGGALWIGGINGALDRLQPADGSIVHFADAIGLQHSSITSLLESHDGRLWIGHQKGLRIFDHDRIRDAPLGPGDAGRRIFSLLEARDGNIYFAAIGAGVERLDPQTLAATPLKPPMPGAAAQQVHQLQQTPDGAIWSAGPAGLARLAPGNETFRFVHGVARGAVDAFAFAQDGSLWMARADRLEHYAITSDHALLLSVAGAAQGWPTVDTGGLEVGTDGRIWATTPRGLAVYDPKQHHVHMFTAPDGLPGPEFFAQTTMRGPDGALYAGTLDGVVRVHTSALRKPDTSPQISVAGLSVRREGRMLRLDATRPIALRWDDRDLTVTAHALSYVDPQHIRYRFKLSGFDPDWVDTGTRDTREFSSLPPGDYLLRVMAAEGDGPWSPSSVPIALHVPAPPWDRPWAWATYALVALIGALALIRAMRQRLEQRHRFAMVAQRQQLAEQANAAKTDFLAGMAHEIRTPMTGVLGMTELLLNTELDERQRGYADGIRRSGALLMRQLNDALDLARIEAGKLELQAAPFDPAALLQEIATLERGLATQKGLSLQISIAADAPRALRGDALRVQQVLLNLAHNALKFTRSGGVRLGLERESAGAVLAVADSGPGLSAQECERVFGRFEQTASGRREHGSGLGLTIARELVALMGGHIELHSEVGVGSTFRVHLPLPECEPGDSREAASPAARAGAGAGSAKRVLLVEDDDVAAEVLAGLLQAQGHFVTRAPHALAALAEVDAEHGRFDMILLDLDLPGMDGCTLAGMLRARGLGMPMLAVTASSRGDEEQKIRAAGMDALLRKPVLPEALSEAMDATSESRKTKVENGKSLA